jgi:hypothetical protein
MSAIIKMQQKVMDYIAQQALESRLEFVDNALSHVSGVVYLQRGFTTYLSFSYMIEGSNIFLEFYKKGVKPKECVGFRESEDCALYICSDYFEIEEDMKNISELIKKSVANSK